MWKKVIEDTNFEKKKKERQKEMTVGEGQEIAMVSGSDEEGCFGKFYDRAWGEKHNKGKSGDGMRRTSVFHARKGQGGGLIPSDKGDSCCGVGGTVFMG